MFTFLSVLYVLVCLFLILVVLLQSGRGGGMGSAFGGGTSQQVFGGAGAGNILTRLTAVCAFLFMVLAIALAYMSSSQERALDRAIEAAQQRSAAGAVTGDAIGTEGAAGEAAEGAPAAFDTDGAMGDDDPAALDADADDEAPAALDGDEATLGLDAPAEGIQAPGLE